MKVSSSIKPAFWGAVCGGILVIVVGFAWGGWMLGGTAEQLAKNRADIAVVEALTPFCIAKAKGDANSKDLLAKLKASSSWEQRGFVEKAGWATMPDATAPNINLARSCADALVKT